LWLDSNRKLKRDLQAELTEASFTGATLSIIVTVVMFALIFAEFNSFLTVNEGMAMTLTLLLIIYACHPSALILMSLLPVD
jgi:hypothetical protein